MSWHAGIDATIAAMLFARVSDTASDLARAATGIQGDAASSHPGKGGHLKMSAYKWQKAGIRPARLVMTLAIKRAELQVDDSLTQCLECADINYCCILN
jgi:hypothetical protein